MCDCRLECKSHILSKEEQKTVAYHDAGYAVFCPTAAALSVPPLLPSPSHHCPATLSVQTPTTALLSSPSHHCCPLPYHHCCLLPPAPLHVTRTLPHCVLLPHHMPLLPPLCATAAGLTASCCLYMPPPPLFTAYMMPLAPILPLSIM